VPELPYTTPSEAGDLAELEVVSEVEQATTPFLELGVTGLKRSTGYIDEEFLPALKGRKGVHIFREMGDNDPITGSLLFSITQLIKGVDFEVVPGGKGPEHTKAAKLVETALEDMTQPFNDTLGEMMSFLQYGWAWHEVVYKRRGGPWQKDARMRSKYDDGLIGWRKMPIRAQETLLRWVFDESGDVKAMVQLGPPDYTTRVLPLSRSLLFRWGHHKGNPEGRSILRTSYRPWYYKKRLEEFESVGVERDLAGLPMVTVPSDYLRAGKDTKQGQMVEAMKKMVRSVRRNEQEGVIFPAAFDRDTKQPLFKFELMSSGGARQHDTNELIQRYEQRQLMTVLADWIMVGHTQTGTYNLHVDKTGIFRDALDATATSIADVFNRHAIPKLFAMNGWRMEQLPLLQPSHVDAPDLTQLTQFLTGTANLGFAWGPDVELEKYLRNAAGLPELGEADEVTHKRMARMDEATRLAETQSRLMAARSELAQALATEQALAAGEQTPDQMAMASDQAAQGQQSQMQAQQMAQGQQQMEFAQSGEQRAADEHEANMSDRATQRFTAMRGQGFGARLNGGSANGNGGKKR
jgi:hypothetical protein